ncbi:predicted protein [Naegleria gruberi]|uniref:Predicted protein n=1 Tax=Naegleria gruberi TaxID=5762 RepID=D2VAW9_NAEGR|nr:uncharacterized protein NAEGRDRAFT_66006 [Naegleria gruberi]EFC46021.1 predicted protein [Naegleria gruberi]|eukprot:XP_002678765.1 predicted protein [Naegleria gruberi strain NEG-M]
MTITRKIKRIVLLKREETSDSNKNNGSDGNNNNTMTQQRGRSSSATSTPDLAPLIISASSSTSSIQDSSSPMSAPSHHSLNSPAMDYAVVKATRVSSIPLNNSVDEHNMFRPFISKTPRGALQSTPGSSSSISSSPNVGTIVDDSCIIETSQPREYVPSRSNTVIGGRAPMEKVASAITPVENDLSMNKLENFEPRLKKTKSASTITVKKKVVIYTQPQKSEITAPPVLENAAKFSLIQAVNNEERLQKLKVEEVEESPLDEESTRSSFSNGNMASPVNVYSPRAFENGLHLTPSNSRPSLDEIGGNPSKLYAFLEDGDLRRSASPRRSTIDENRRSTITKSDIGEDLFNNGIELAIPPELENVGNYGHVSLEKFMQERNKKYRGSLRGLHSLSQKPSLSSIEEEGQHEQSSIQPNVQISHNVYETDGECSKFTSYKLSNCCNVQSSLDQSTLLESFYPLPEGSLSFEIKSLPGNQERQLKISFKAKKSINVDLHKIMMEIITHDTSNERIHQLEDYEWSMVMETSSYFPTSKDLLRRIISENQKDTSQGFQFKSFSHLSNFIGNAIQEEIKRRLPHSSSGINGENLRLALVFTQNDFIPNTISSIPEHNHDSTIQELLKNEKVDFNFTDCLETHFGKEIVSCSSKLMFLCVQFYSPLLDSNIQFKLPLLPNNVTGETQREQVIQTLEEQVAQLESELEEILYQKYMWEFLMKYTFKVFDSRIIDTTRVSIMNQKRTLKYIGGEKATWTSCVCRCPITPGRFVDGNLESNSVHGDLSSLKTNHILSLRLDSFPTGSDIFIGIINANHTAEQILQNYVVSGKSDSHTFFLKDKQFRHGSLIINSISNNADSEYSFSDGDVIQVVLNYSNMNINVYRNYQRILPSFAPNAIDLENTEWYFVVGLSQNGQQITLI